MKKEDKQTRPPDNSPETPPLINPAYSADGLCRSFLEYFKSKQHRVVASAPLLPEDPTLLFTAAGMVPFKSHYIDPQNAPYPRIASVQKCLRAGGKQSDLENVGKTLRHHTFFEMLGNFSFGDYFKKEAIDYGWELSVDVWKLQPERIWISVYLDDDEAWDLWTRRIGVPEARMVRLDKADNFWGPVGDTGVCGPCSEMYFDTGPEQGCGGKDCRPGCDCDRFIEFWNLVFTQFFYTEEGVYDDLPRPGIDTGLGLERLAFILQEVKDNFHTDHFLPIRQAVVRALPDGREPAAARQPVNVAADHVRALTFALAEGILPSNEGRGYILKRLLRRAVTKLHPFGVCRPFMASAVDAVVAVMKNRYPELPGRAGLVKEVVTAEEERFLSTLEQGLDKLQSIIKRSQKKGLEAVAGKDAFLLYDTFGFPIELTEELAEEVGLRVDVDGFTAAMADQKTRGRQQSFHIGGSGKLMEFVELRELKDTKFLGYDSLICEAAVCAFRIAPDPAGKGKKEAVKNRPIVEVVTDRTVFYAESGGQVGDVGLVRFGDREFQVAGAYPDNQRTVHRLEWDGRPEPEKLSRFFSEHPTGEFAVDENCRLATARNHTATHLLHAALRQVLGDHVIQAGSLVDVDRLRFDFHHYQAMRREEIARVEDLVNGVILDDRPVFHEVMAYQDAIDRGAMALFGEKYTDEVRMVSVEGFSRELCGGTHLKRTGQAGLFFLKQESAVAAGVRRIEALTGTGARRYMSGVIDSRNRIADNLKVSADDLERRVSGLVEEVAALRKRLTSKKGAATSEILDQGVRQAENINGIKLVSVEVDAPDVPTLRQYGDRLREKLDFGVGLLCQKRADKPIMLILVTENVIRERAVKANELASKIGESFSLRGGGKPHLSQLGLGTRQDFKKIQKFLKKILGAD